MHWIQVRLGIYHPAKRGLLEKFVWISHICGVCWGLSVFSLWLKLSQHYPLSIIKWTAQIVYDHHCLLGSTAFLNTLFWNNLSLFHYSERPCFTPIKWYNCLKYNAYNKFIYHIFSGWGRPLRCRLFAGDSVDTWGKFRCSLCIWLLLQCGGPVVALHSWQKPVSGRETKNIHYSGKWICFFYFNYVAHSWNV